ncbi:class I SAM-dependent methyltransferase [Streptomyces sp. me109]|uniref:class I SAM-dependent methyltransferase n=1 Tax=Streptomyces sp. me109 TaxID=1827853 RepID=UPI0011CD5278|nr:class I SAM-dependent methyltransferase [Streptomyces sp. me109]TXS74326.1 class I SAM-dependent methyltransferase [Streptomyces sp. me109]
MTLGFGGEVAEYYAKFRRGYPSELFDALQAAFALTTDDAVLDLGCGTGQLAVPLASRVRSVIGMDPEPDMLRLARQSAAGRGVTNATWVVGGDTDVPALGKVAGPRSLAMTVIGQALHWMRHEDLFHDLKPLLRPQGGIAVVTNGTPLWLQDTSWSRALRTCLERHFGTELTAMCGTSPQERRAYARALDGAGFHDVQEVVTEYSDELDFDQLIGGIYSAIPEGELPAPQDRAAFAEHIRQALPTDQPFTEQVRVCALIGLTR